VSDLARRGGTERGCSIAEHGAITTRARRGAARPAASPPAGRDRIRKPLLAAVTQAMADGPELDPLDVTAMRTDHLDQSRIQHRRNPERARHVSTQPVR
jgi:hypothetical protein